MPFGLPASPGPNTRRRRRNQALLWIGTIAVTVTLMLSLNGAATGWGVPVAVQRVVMVVAVLVLLGLSWLQWRELDEVGRRAHTLAFYWSGCTVWTLTLIVVGLSAAGGDFTGPMFPVYGSAFLVIGLHAALYGVFYAVIWLRNNLP